jgi:class 3 adenylate cyclase/tetratricopeptide (TPR) repeat protein
MTFDEMLAQVLALLQREGRVSYRALQRRFDLDQEYLEDLKAEIIDAKRLAVDEAGKVLVWTGEPRTAGTSPTHRQRAPLSYTPRYLAEKILTSRSAMEGERKHVTVLFADLEGSTALAEAVDPEVMHEVLDGAFDLMLAEVHRVEGTVNQFTGDGIMALFGAPIAHEDHVVRALHAALGIQRAFAAYADTLRRSQGINLRLRLGIHAGPVVVGKIGDDLRMDYTAQGFTTHLANRLQTLAKEGAVYVSQEVQQEAEGFFQFEDLGPFTIAGSVQPVQVYECTGLGHVTSRLELSLRRGLSTFIGREQELDQLGALWAMARGGQGQMVCLVGEAGVGKSRLVYEFRRTLTGIRFLEAQTLSYGHAMPYHAFLPLLRSVLGLTDSDHPQQQRERIRSRLYDLDPAYADDEPFLAHLLGVPLEPQQLPSLPPQEQKRRTQQACLQLILQQAANTPLCLLIEDLHWLDSGSQELLDLLSATLDQRPVLLLGTTRPDFRPTWGERPGRHWLTVAPLSREHTETFVCHWCRPLGASGTLMTLICERTEGNPFFVEEMLRALQERQLLEVQNGSYVIQVSTHVEIPSSIHGLLAARVDRLGDAMKEVLQVGAVIGREFPLWLLEATVDRTPLHAELMALQRLDLLAEKTALPEPVYLFTHALTREVVYASLLNQAKKKLHGQIGQALEQRYAGRTQELVHLLHHHFSLAEDWPKAVRYGWQAAQKSCRMNHLHEALMLFEQAQTWLTHLPQDRSQQETLIDLQLDMDWALLYSGQPDRLLEICREAEAVARALQDRIRLGKVFFLYSAAYAFKGDYTQAEPYALQALEQLAGSGEEALIAATQFAFAIGYNAQGQWKKAAPLLAESLRAQEAQGLQTAYPEWGFDFLPYAFGCAALAYNLALQGRIAAAQDLLHKGYQPEIERASNPVTKAHYAGWHSLFAALIGEDCGALARAEELLTLAAAADAPILRFGGYTAQGTALMAVERFAAAREAYTHALQAIAGTSHRDALGLVYANLARANLALGDWSAAQHYYQAGLPLVQLTPERESPRFDYVQGQLLASQQSPDLAQAAACFERSIQADETAGAVVLAAQTRFSLAQVLARQGDDARARSLLATLRDQFQAWGIPVWQHKCAQALTTLE